MEDYYSTLGLSPGASQDEIKAAFRQLAKENHPDMGGSEEKFKLISEAYRVLSGKEQGQNIGGFDGFEAGEFDINIDDVMKRFFGDRFRGGFGGGMHPRDPPREDADNNIGFQINVTLEQIKKGFVDVIQYPRTVKCKVCNGVGGKNKQKCSSCNGRGMITRRINKNMIQQMTCQNCGGEGYIFEEICLNCKGNGFYKEMESVRIKIEEARENVKN